MKLEKYKTERERLAAVKEDPFEIRYIGNPSVEVQRQALKNGHGYLIKYIDKPAYAIQLMAVLENPDNISYIANPAKRVQAVAIFKKPNSAHWISPACKASRAFIVNSIKHMDLARTK